VVRKHTTSAEIFLHLYEDLGLFTLSISQSEAPIRHPRDTMIYHLLSRLFCLIAKESLANVTNSTIRTELGC